MGEQYMILGYSRVTGEYEGRPYDNYNFYVQDLSKNADAGIVAGKVKVKTDVILQCGVPINGECIGSMLEVYYNKYGQVSGINILNEPKGAGK